MPLSDNQATILQVTSPFSSDVVSCERKKKQKQTKKELFPSCTYTSNARFIPMKALSHERTVTISIENTQPAQFTVTSLNLAVCIQKHTQSTKQLCTCRCQQKIPTHLCVCWKGRLVCWLVAHHTSNMQSVSQRWICSDNCTCYHTEMAVADQTCYLTKSQCTDTRPTTLRSYHMMAGTWQGSR